MLKSDTLSLVLELINRRQIEVLSPSGWDTLFLRCFLPLFYVILVVVDDGSNLLPDQILQQMRTELI